MAENIEKPIISEKFDLDDIRKIREYNSLRHIKMTPEEIVAEYRESTSEFMEKLKSFQTKKKDLSDPYEEQALMTAVIAEEPGTYTDKAQ